MKEENNRVQRLVIKVGSNVLTRLDGTLDVTRMSALVDQVAELRQRGIEVILVSSGAVASGRSEVQAVKKLDSVEQRQLFSAVGQAKLINRYYELFREHHMAVGQVLTTKENFGTRRHYLNQKRCMSVMLENGVIPIVNENDTISVTELMFTDNDELSGLIASMMDAQLLVILSNIDGIYNGNPADSTSEVIREIAPGMDLDNYIQTGKSSFGRGGMITKTRIARQVADEGITVVIANGRREQILIQLIEALEEKPLSAGTASAAATTAATTTVTSAAATTTATTAATTVATLPTTSAQALPFTRFIPATTPTSSVKKWIAHSEGFAKGEIHLNAAASALLLEEKPISILPVGITAVKGEFEKDDIVRIIGNDGQSLGVGRVSCNAAQVSAVMGKHGKKPVVHYDYLCIDTNL